MIVFKDVFKLLEQHGWSQYRLRKEKLISNGTMQRLREGLSVSTETVNVICKLCRCQPGDILEYVEKEQP